MKINIEGERETLHCNEISAEPAAPSILNIESYGSNNKLLRVTALMFHFIENMKRRRIKGALTADEITKAEEYLNKETQKCIKPLLTNIGSSRMEVFS